jgi:hypothetical protein
VKNSKVKKPANLEQNKTAKLVIIKCAGELDNPKSWAMHMVAFKRLWKDFPNDEFWREYFQPWRGQYPMFAYTGEKGKQYIKDQYKSFLIDKQEQDSYNSGQEEISNKPMSLMEFLQKGHLK